MAGSVFAGYLRYSRTISFDRRIEDQMIVVVEEAGYLTVESEGTPPVFAVNGE